MGDGSACGGCDAEKDLDDITCHCKHGYMNEEGTFVPGVSVRSGNALAKKDYEQHKDCRICPTAPTSCPSRMQRLAHPQRPRPSRGQPEYVEFFVPSKDVSPAVLEAYLSINGGRDQFHRGGKKFKGEEGFYVKSRIRFNSAMIQELRDLTTRQRRGRQLTWTDFTTRIPPTAGPYSEFKTFLDTGTPRTSDSRTSDSRTSNSRTSEPRMNRASEGRKSADRHTTTESRHEDGENGLADGFGSLEIRTRPESPPGPGYGDADYSPGQEVSQKSARHSIDRIMDPEDDRDREGLDSIPTTRPFRRPSTLESDPRYTRSRTDTYDLDSARHQSQRDDNQRRQRSPNDGPRLSDRHAPVSQDSSRQKSVISQNMSSRLERPPPTSIASQPTPMEGARSRREESGMRAQGVDFFVPEEDVDIEVLAAYVKEYIDPKASIKRSKHPKDERRSGLLVHAVRAMNVDSIRDVARDTKLWEEEQESRDFRRRPYKYQDSDTMKRRRKKGSSQRFS